MTELVINIEEKFEHLPRAPIAEAVIDIRARAAAVLEEGALKPLLEAKLAGYQFFGLTARDRDSARGACGG